MPFSELYRAVMQQVQAGTVERWVHADTGLEVFSYLQSCRPPASSTAAMCRGLVLHQASSKVVTMPFVRFGHLSDGPAAGNGWQQQPEAEEEQEADPRDEVLLAAAACEPVDVLSPAAASFKVDGSLVIAFMWHGRLMVTTRRRMDSEQVGWWWWAAGLLSGSDVHGQAEHVPLLAG
jgi:hypothetical protein